MIQESYVSSPDVFSEEFIGKEINVFLADPNLHQPNHIKVGNYSYVLDFGHMIIRVPRNETGLERLVKEEVLCNRFRRSGLHIPYMKVIHGRYPFCFHSKIQGEHLTTEAYESLSEEQKEALARKLAKFLSKLHEIPTDQAREFGLEALASYTLHRTMTSHANKVIKGPMRNHYMQFISAYKDFNAFQGKRVVGHFKVRGDNMAFDPEKGTLEGLYDFVDAGIADVHQEFAPLNTISADLTERVVGHCCKETGEDISIDRVNFYSALQYYSELFENYLRMQRAKELESAFSVIQSLRYNPSAV